MAITSGDYLGTGVSESGVAHHVPTVVHVTASLMDNTDSEQLPIPSTKTRLQIATLSPRSFSIAGGTDDDEDYSESHRESDPFEGSDGGNSTYIDEDNLPPDILPLKQLREDALKLVPPEKLNPDFIPFWCPEDREKRYKATIAKSLRPAAIDEPSWLLLRNCIPFHFVSLQIALWY